MDRSKFLPRTTVVDRRSAVAELVRDLDVLHIGMGGFLENEGKTDSYVASDLSRSMHGYLSGTAARLTGMDLNPRTVEAMRDLIPGEYVVGDVADPTTPGKLNRSFDAVLFLDVIEHLDNIRPALQNIRQLLNADGRVIITTANAYCFEAILKMLLRYEAVHEEHTSYFSYLTMKRLLAMNGLEIETFLFCNEDERRPAGVLDWLSCACLKAVSWILPQYAQGILVVAKPVPKL